MPRVTDSSKFYVQEWQGKKERKLRTGRDIFEQVSRTDLNRAPIDTLKSHILKGALMMPAVSIPPIQPDSLAESLLVEGSIILYGSGLDYEKLEDVVVFNKWFGMQILNCEDYKNSVVRVFTLSPGPGKDPKASDAIGWNIRTYNGFDLTKKLKTKKLESYIATIPQEDIEEDLYVDLSVVYMHPNGRGILYYTQRAFSRLEEIDNTIAEQTKPDNMKTIVTGYQGGDEQLKREWEAAGRLFRMPGEGIKFHDMTNASIIAQLMDQFYKKRKDYLESCRVVYITDAFNVSGVARRLQMTHMLHFVNDIQERMREIYRDFGFEISFDQSNLLDVEERSKELEFLERQKELGNIDEVEFKTRSRKLL